MSLDYIRNYYKVPAYQDRAVTYKGRRAKIVGASQQYLRLRFDDEKEDCTGRYHPTWKIDYCPTHPSGDR